MEQIADWLKKLGLSEYAQCFVENGIGVELPHLTDQDLKEIGVLLGQDIIGTNFVLEGPRAKEIRFEKGPLFCQILLDDEINRATPKTQSALLEAMQKAAVTVGGLHHTLKEPFIVFATQNPIEMEGTYPLPEAQLDRFLFKLRMPFPDHNELTQIIDRVTTPLEARVKKVANSEKIVEMRTLILGVPLASKVKDYVAHRNGDAPRKLR